MVNAFEVALDTAWAMQQEALSLLLRIAAREGDPEAVATKLGARLENSRKVTLRDGVAVIPVTGPIFRRANLFTEISGATSVEMLALDLQRAVENEGARAILLDIDSPGGQATGIGELAGLIAAACKRKPVLCYTGGMAASAGYWLAAACDSITVAPTALVGSIGVAGAVRRGNSDEVEFVSSQSPKKRPDVDTEDGRAEIQRVIDDMAAVFVADVAKYRGVSQTTVLNDFGQGGILVGRAAVRAGMADRIGSYESLMRRLSTPAGIEEMRKRPGAEAGGEPVALDDPTFEAAPPAGVTFETQLDAALAAVGGCIERAQAIHARREAEGRSLSQARRRQIAELHAGLGTLLRETRPGVTCPDLRVLRLKASERDGRLHTTGLAGAIP